MKESDPKKFFIGWAPDWNEGWEGFHRNVVRLIGILVIGFSAMMVFLQPSYKDSSFDFPNLSQVAGILFKHPVPHIVAEDEAYLLTGFGKFGASDDIRVVEEEYGINTEGMAVEISGTRINYDNHTLYELTLGKASLEIQAGIDTVAQNMVHSVGDSVFITGEIIDPKCFFGAMNPANGKIHRSCAIRCLSGGIPAVFAASHEQAPTTYYIITDKEGNSVNQWLIPYVGEPVSIRGLARDFHNWKWIMIDPEKHPVKPLVYEPRDI
jgi:hypothetical protein